MAVGRDGDVEARLIILLEVLGQDSWTVEMGFQVEAHHLPPMVSPQPASPWSCCSLALSGVWMHSFALVETQSTTRMKKKMMMMKVRELGGALRFVMSLEFWRMALLWTIAIFVSYLQLLFPQKVIPRDSAVYPCCASLPSVGGHKRPVCIITGASSGLGAAAAAALSKEGFLVILVGRSLQMLYKTMDSIKDGNKDACLKAFEVDLSAFQSIVEFKDSLEKWLLDSDMHPSIQLLINNAGILATSNRLTAEGHDMMMGTNYIGAFSLTRLLLPLLKNSPVGARIVNVTSFTHRTVSSVKIDKETVSGKCFLRSNGYPFARVYEYSKLCLLLFTYQLNRQLHLMGESFPISVNAADPGVVKTNIMREVPPPLSQAAYMVLGLLGFLQAPENGVSSIIDAALAPPETSGAYFFGGKGRTVNSSAVSRNMLLAEKLWATSSDLFVESNLASHPTCASGSSDRSCGEAQIES